MNADQKFARIQEIQRAIIKELARAEHLFPHWPTTEGPDHIHAAAIVAEEAGEILKAANNWQTHGTGNLEHIRTEAIQTAAMSFRFLLEMDRVEAERSKAKNNDKPQMPQDDNVADDEHVIERPFGGALVDVPRLRTEL